MNRDYWNFSGFVYRNKQPMLSHIGVSPADLNADVSMFYEMAQGKGRPTTQTILLGGGEVMVGFLATEPYLFLNYGEEPLGPYLKSKSLNKYIYAGAVKGYRFLLWYFNPMAIRLAAYLIEPDSTRWEGICGNRYGYAYNSVEPDTIPFPAPTR